MGGSKSPREGVPSQEGLIKLLSHIFDGELILKSIIYIKLLILHGISSSQYNLIFYLNFYQYLRRREKNVITVYKFMSADIGYFYLHIFRLTRKFSFT